ncbi:MAG TPA: glycine--tRNA ligase subunit beta [Caldisericia bacterium]|nr:glycine--tRNA ligase subunit beta [Caldisericia bacterium]HOR46669.1 glycine--tRNA ligase subunit beta [Caldisericia bacterium]HOU07873.1 glycine--tRNA ligase subunit beta [Caldisericia bacterium]HQG59650.1 glycine--tRNA ligase subunit beta [Caldisericia bacterium]HQH48892.1 glycine--tRNA ligase subunit beta [Caldisericia bacterium]
MRSLLIEIGCEELPSRLVKPAIIYLMEGMCGALKEAELSFSSPKTFATPRRLALLFDSVQESGPSKTVEEKGPPKSACFDKDGNPTKALQGFAVKVGIEPKDVVFGEISGGVYATAKKIVPGKTIEEVVSSSLSKVVLSFPHPHSMRWDETGISWVRPIRWIVAMSDDVVIDVSIGNAKSSNFTMSPRPERSRKVEIATASKYPEVLSSMGVVGNLEERSEHIFEKAQKLASSLGMEALKNKDLLDELASIVERPLVWQGEFPFDYLESAPELVIKTVLMGDLRFIPFTKDGKLTNNFAFVINGPAQIAQTVLEGELKVLLGRLSDARFFFAEDRKKKLVDFAGKLSGVAFLKGLGTLRDKTERLVELSKMVQLGVDKNKLEKASSLAKADLASSMVHEHDDLQGRIGGLYAELDGEDGEVALAISEHYLPAGEDDPVPSSALGQALSLVDKADSLVNIAASGNMPKGSADPFGVRRFAIGIIRVLVEGSLSVNLTDLLVSCSKLGFKRSDDAVQKSVDFIKARLENYLRSKGYRYDVVRAAISPGIEQLKEVMGRADAMQAIYESKEFAGIVATAKRLNNILRDYAPTGNYDTALFEDDVEREFEVSCKNVFKSVASSNDFAEKLRLLCNLTDPAEKYFDTVMVNAEDEKIKANRKNFLSGLLQKYREVSDFVEIAI